MQPLKQIPLSGKSGDDWDYPCVKRIRIFGLK